MTGFDLPQNFHSNLELFLRRVRPHIVPPQISLSAAEPVIALSSAPRAMAQKTLRDYFAPFASQVPTGPEVNIEGENFEIKSGLITMVQANPFCGKANEDASANLQQFLELCSTFVIKGVSQDAIRLCLFPFSLLGRAKQWFYANKAAVDTWYKCAKAFLSKFFPTGKTNALRGRISNFQQASNESIPEAWERLQDYILACQPHGMDNWLILQNFYNGLTQSSRDHVDATAGGAIFSLTTERATSLIEKMVSNQG